jgi:glycine betaine catabolism A
VAVRNAFGATLPGPGSFLNVEIANQSILLVRNRDNDLRTLLNLCRHRGSLISAEKGETFGRSIR